MNITKALQRGEITTAIYLFICHRIKGPYFHEYAEPIFSPGGIAFVGSVSFLSTILLFLVHYGFGVIATVSMVVFFCELHTAYKFHKFYKRLIEFFGSNRWREILRVQTPDGSFVPIAEDRLVDLWMKVAIIEQEFPHDYKERHDWEQSRNNFKETHQFFLDNGLTGSKDWRYFIDRANDRLKLI